MSINYYKAHSTERPLEIDTELSKSGVYLRKNIQEITPEDNEENKYYEYDEAFLTHEEYEEYKNADNLTMTALDFITFIQSAGITLEQIYAYLDLHLDIKAQLTFCQNVYFGVVKQLLPLTVEDITITEEMAEHAFRVKNGMV